MAEVGEERIAGHKVKRASAWFGRCSETRS